MYSQSACVDVAVLSLVMLIDFLLLRDRFAWSRVVSEVFVRACMIAFKVVQRANDCSALDDSVGRNDR